MTGPTTGKIERWHKTLRGEFLTGKVFDSIDDAQAQLDAWVWTYNHERPHQSVGGKPPVARFALAAPAPRPVPETVADADPVGPTRKVTSKGVVSFAGALYKAGRWLTGESVEVVCDSGLVQLFHRGTLVATHAQRHPATKQTAAEQRGRRPAPAKAARTATTASVTRKVDTSGSVCFAGSCYRVGNALKRRQVQVAVVGDTVEISIGEQLIRTHSAQARPHP